jgi:nitric oxide reductase subunit B
MTELLILAHLILQWRKTMSAARKNYHIIPYRLLSFADVWIILNLILAIAISVPAWNYYTHGTHITVAHAMGATIGINTFLLMASVFYICKKEKEELLEKQKPLIGKSIIITNISLLIFWISLLGMGLVKISSRLNNEIFAAMMQKSSPWFHVFAYSGIVLMAGLFFLSLTATRLLTVKNNSFKLS